MGVFPYDCPLCGGAHKRCGVINTLRREYIEQNKGEYFEELLLRYRESFKGMNSEEIRDSDQISDEDYIEDLAEHFECKGGQGCWESKVYFEFRGEIVQGFYTGYGSVNYDDKEIHSLTFEKYFYAWKVEHTTPLLVCASCFEDPKNAQKIEELFPLFIKDEKLNEEEILYKRFLGTLKNQMLYISKHGYTKDLNKKEMAHLFWIEDFGAKPYVDSKNKDEDEDDEDLALELESLKVSDEVNEIEDIEEEEMAEQWNMDYNSKQEDLKKAKTAEEKILINYTYARSHQDILDIVETELKNAGYNSGYMYTSLQYELFWTRCKQFL
jgi:hypothetical protein